MAEIAQWINAARAVRVYDLYTCKDLSDDASSAGYIIAVERALMPRLYCMCNRGRRIMARATAGVLL